MKLEGSNDNNSLLPDYSKTGDIALQNLKTLRRLVGVLGMLLPVFLYATILVDSGFTTVLPSLSHYYFTRACGSFIICVSLMAIFLLIYKGESPRDYIISGIAGTAALLVVLFPTNNLLNMGGGDYHLVNVTILKEGPFRGPFHYSAAALFLLSLAYMSFFIFTKSNQPPEKRTVGKRRRNRVFRSCAAIMVAALLVIFLGFVKLIPPSFYDGNHLTFWMEVVAIEAFGFSWLIKGQLWLCDPK